MRPTNPDLPPVALADLPRAMHYGEFYGLKPIPDEKPLLVVHGNCQAEAIRLLLQEAEDAPCVSVRVPAVHELTPDEIPLLQRLLGRAAVVLTQPVTDGYQDLPLGASEVQEAAPEARVVRWPVVWYAGLLPWQVVFTHPEEGDPPVVPYHDVRTVMLALGEPVPTAGPEGFRAVARSSLAELRDREARAGAVPVSQLVVDAGARATNTVNHPGNPVLVSLARALQDRLGWPVTATDPGDELLESVQTPCEGKVLAALGIERSNGRDVSEESWVVGGREVPDAEVVEAQLDWYRQHPEVLAAVATRSAERWCLLGTTGA
ncbi:MAG: WcbI family polysaccharide biosynthesis putative acetyltransferase [Actinomycetales bacterium]